MSISSSLGQTLLSMVGLHIINNVPRYQTFEINEYESDGRIGIRPYSSTNGEYVKLIDIINLLKETPNEVNKKE